MPASCACIRKASSRSWWNRHLNIHPSLLPAFRGLHTHARVLDEGVKITGCTVHFVRPEMDTGPIVAQAAVPVLPGDTADSLAARVLAAEHASIRMRCAWSPPARSASKASVWWE